MMKVFYKFGFRLFLLSFFFQPQMLAAEVIRTYYPNGQIKGEFHKEKGKLHGQTLWYYPDGALGALMTYQNNKLHGKSETYYQNGHVKKFIQMKDNKAVGISENFSLDGKREVTEFYFDGSVVSRWIYDKNESNLFCEETRTLANVDNMKWNLDLSDELK